MKLEASPIKDGATGIVQIQLQMANQYCSFTVFTIRQLENVEVDRAGVKTLAYFEVIKIMDEKDPYPTLLGI